MLNSRTSSRFFASGISVAEIEGFILNRLEKIAPQQTVQFGRPVDDPFSLARSENLDCILWAGGRRSLDDSVRSALGCESRVGKSENVLVFQIFELQGGGDIWQYASLDHTGVVRQAASVPTLRVMLRPGQAGVSAGWLWIFGLPSDTEFSAASLDVTRFETMMEALDSILDAAVSPNAAGLRSAVEVLQQRIRPASCGLRRVDAAFWSSDHVVNELASMSDCSPSCPMVLLGDAACGKPFYTGTTLNRHFWDAAALVDDVDWTHDGGVLTRTCFDAYEKRYQSELLRIQEFGRRNPEPAPPKGVAALSQGPPSAPRQVVPFVKRPPAPTPKNFTATSRLRPLSGVKSSTS
jgi:hypothetical protein